MTAPAAPDVMSRAIRRIAVLIIACCVVSAVLAPMPGVRTYRDANRCADQAWGSLFTMEHGRHERCEPNWVETGTSPAGDVSLAILLVPTVLCGLLVARRPRRRWAALWSGGTLAVTAVFVVATFELNFDLLSSKREVILWPRQALGVALQGIYLFHLAQLIVLAIAAIRGAALRRRARRDAALDPMPRATVVKRGDD